jgi:hypothetical protein
MVLLLLIAVVVIAGLAWGWRVFAAETSPRAANALLLILGVAGFAWWLASNATFDAGV